MLSTVVCELYVSILDNFDEINKSLEKQKLPIWIQEKIENSNGPLTWKEL